MLEYLNGELLTYALTIGMTPYQYWFDNPQLFFNYTDCYNNKAKIEIERMDYLAWRTGESVKSALETTAVVSIMTNGKEAEKALKKAKYQEAPAYVLIERQNNPEEKIKAEKKRLETWINNIKPKKQL